MGQVIVQGMWGGGSKLPCDITETCRQSLLEGESTGRDAEVLP